MIFGILPNGSSAETCLNNLSEIGFKLADVSLVMQDLKVRDAIAKDTGPLKGIGVANLPAKLAQMGLLSQDVKACVDAVTQGKALIVMKTPKGSEKAALDALNDYSPILAKVV
jgi:hypothetical protein